MRRPPSRLGEWEVEEEDEDGWSSTLGDHIVGSVRKRVSPNQLKKSVRRADKRCGGEEEARVAGVGEQEGGSVLNNNPPELVYSSGGEESDDSDDEEGSSLQQTRRRRRGMQRGPRSRRSGRIHEESDNFEDLAIEGSGRGTSEDRGDRSDVRDRSEGDREGDDDEGVERGNHNGDEIAGQALLPPPPPQLPVWCL